MDVSIWIYECGVEIKLQVRRHAQVLDTANTLGRRNALLLPSGGRKEEEEEEEEEDTNKDCQLLLPQIVRDGE